MSQGRNDSLHINLEWTGVAGNSGLQPLWSYANEWGVYSAFDKNESVLKAKVQYRIVGTRHFFVEAGIGAVAKGLLDDGFLHEGYLRGRWQMIDFQAGMLSHSPIGVNDGLTTGSFLMSANARPIPKVGIGIFDYYVLPFTGNRVAVRGGIYQGWPLDDDNPKSTDDVLLHEKFAYVRWNRWKLKPYAGLIHNAYFGGTLPDGTKIETDFWATLRAAGSAKIGGGEATNAAGAHLGLWDFGFDYDGDGYRMKLYYQKPFADGSGLKLTEGNNRDHILGLYYSCNERKLLSAWSIEWVKTDYQSGAGLPDPFDPVNNVGVWPGEITDGNCRQWMANRFPDVDTKGWKKDNVYQFLRKEWNHGKSFGGRDTYMNNGMYYQGSTHKGLSTGTPLLHTSQMFKAYAPDGVFVDAMNFVNTRVVALHAGAEGYLSDRLSYRLKYTCSWNKGSYIGTYTGHYSWDHTPDYYFDSTKMEHYSYCRMDYRVGIKKNVGIFGSLAYDFGDLYHSLGGHLGIKFDFGL